MSLENEASEAYAKGRCTDKSTYKNVVSQSFRAGVYWERDRHSQECGNEFNHVIILKEKLMLAREFIYEVSLPKFKDSDADSLLKTLQSNAKKFIEATKQTVRKR